MKTSITNLRKALLILLFCLAGVAQAMAQSFTVGDLNYSVNTDGTTVTVTGHVDGTAATGPLVIPESVTYEGTAYAVTVIGEDAFRYCWGLTGELSIPNSVTTIGYYAFCHCSGFTGNLNIPNSVITINDGAFYECYHLTGNLNIPNSVTSIGSEAFLGCYDFTGNLNIPNSVTSIGHQTFSYCSGLTSVTIPNTITSIEWNPFMGCSGLEQIVVATGNPVYDSRDNCNAIIKTNTNVLISGCKNSIIPNSVTTIGEDAFYGCYDLVSITIPNSVTSIRSAAFGHSGLISATIPNSVTFIGANSFSGSSGLEQIVVAQGNPIYDSRNNCNAIINTSTNGLIVGCKTSTIPNSVTLIDTCAFSGCYELNSIVIPNSVTSIGYGAFDDCYGLTSIEIPNSVLSIGDYAFGFCDGLSSVTIGNSVTSIGNGAFDGCYGLTSIEIPNSVLSIGNWAFVGCLGLTSIVIPNSVLSIGNWAFEACEGLTSINIPSSVTYIGENPFSGCSGLEHIEVASGNAFYDSRNNCNAIIETSTNELISGCKNSIIPNSVTSIGNMAFESCYELTSVVIPYSVLSIGEFAFAWTNLSLMVVQVETPPSLYYGAFSDVSKDIPIYVPIGTIEAYQNAYGWNEFTNYHDISENNTITAICNPAEGGSATGGGTFTTGETCTLSATANEGFTFMNWSYNGNVVSTEPIYSFIVTEAAEYLANFECNNFGDFTYMTPTDNYPFTFLPIEFTWDAVFNAQHYDLYLWNANDPMPEEPHVSGLTTGYYRCTSLPNHQTYQWYVKAYNDCHEVNSSIRSFTLDVEPAINVNMSSIDFGEVALNHTALTSLNIEGVMLEDSIQIQLVGGDASMFSFTTANGWDDFTGGSILVDFTPTVSQYEFHATLVISSGSLTQSIPLSGSVADIYVFNTIVDDDVYAMNTNIPIHGTVTDNENNPVTNEEVEIGIFVMGMRRSLQTTTNENGEFSATFEPIPSESGYYTVNSGRVGNNSTAVHDDFNIPGMSVVTDGYILCAVTQDQPKTDSILIRNKSNLPLDDIQVSVLSAPEGCSFSFSSLNLGSSEEDYLVYTVTGSTLTQGDYYKEVRLNVTSNEGAETVITIWYYCMEPRGILEVAPKSLVNTMTKGKSKIVDVMLTNNGTDTTGNIFIDLPDVEWMSLVGNDTLPSLAVNDTAYFSLRFSPDDDTQLVQYTGNIAINCEHGEFADLPFAITAVSDSTGAIVVDITDDYTWNTNDGNGPHLEGAKVTLTGYYSLETVAQGYTDANGIFQVDNLPEGYYSLHVEAEHHAQYDNNILITSGETTNRSIYLQYQAVTYSWTVEPTEIPDEYTYELNVVYETNVPAPVVTIGISSQVPELEYGEAYTFNAIITNHGLIAANDFQLILPNLDEFEFYALYDFIDTLPAQTTVVIPITVNKVQSGRNTYSTREDDPCWARLGAMMYYVCGRDYEHNSDNYVWHHAYSRKVFVNTCVLNALADHLPSLPCFGCGGGGNGSGNGSGGIEIIEPAIHYVVGCHPCDELLKDVIFSLPIMSDFNYVAGFIGGNQSAYDHVIYWGGKLPFVGWIFQLTGFTVNMAVYLHCLADYSGLKNQWLNLDDFDYVFRLNDNIIEIYHEFYQDDLLYEKQGFALLNSLMIPYYSEIIEISEGDAETIKSNLNNLDIPVETIEAIINRWNQTVAAWNDSVFEPDMSHPNIINKVHLESIGSDIGELCDYVTSIGYESFYAMIEDLYDILDEEVNQMSNSVCSTVTVQFSQKMTMTREAFEGTFTVHNGHNENSMEGIGLNFTVKDEDGNDCADLFQINTTSLTNLTAIDGTGSLSPAMDGIAKILFIPSKAAAPIEPKVYYFGGTFSFIDPYTSDELVYDLYPVDLTVHPSPDLHVDYFMQRDILGDDALTLDKVEPSIPAELGVIIHNKGAGIAKNVILETAEPKIIDNEKGLAIDFAMYGASFNGNEAQLGMMAIPFGNIESGHTAVGEWLFTSSLLGHFVSYEANVIHNNSYGNPNLSLVSRLDIHELIRPIRAYGDLDDGINDFLVNDVADYYDYPDSIYFSNGGKTGVGLADDLHFDHFASPQDTVVILTLSPSRVGWNYGVTDDPGSDKYELVSCTRRSDNQVIPMNNVWQTFVTLHDASDPIYENKLHIVDTLSNDNLDYTYTLVYSKKKELLEVEKIIGIPESDFIDYPLENFSVKFNRPIADSTFTYEDMVLKCNNGSNLMNPSVSISKVDDDLYNVDITGLTYQTGYYVLNVNTLNINDAQGYSGYEGEQATWIQVLDGDVFVHINGDQTICGNEAFEPLTSIVIGEYTSLQWKRNGSPIAGANELNYQPLGSGVYTLSVSFANGEVLISNEVTLVSNPINEITIYDEICEGDEYIFNDFVMTGLSAGVYYETLNLENAFHCDSIVSLQLVVLETPEVQIQIDTIHNNGIGFRLTAMGAESYEWSTGEASASIMVSPTEPTTYTVVGSNAHGCSDIAAVTVSGGTGVEEGMTLSAEVYPNPAHDKLFIKTNETVNSIEIFTMTGTLVQRQPYHSNNMEINVQSLSPGLYVIRMATDQAIVTRRFVKD